MGREGIREKEGDGKRGGKKEGVKKGERERGRETESGERGR